jgi:hypothetical protein
MGADSLSDVVVTVVGNAVTQLQSHFTATLNIDGTKEPAPFDAGLLSYRYRPLDGPVKDARLMPSDTAGPAVGPHYGVGGFHHFSPDGYHLAVPTPLVIDYKDEDIAGLDESTFALYAWDETTKDWAYVGGVLDAGANTITAPIDTFRLYTVAPAMPARTVALAVTQQTANGSGDAQTLHFRVSSGPLVMNNGQPVPDGTLFSVRSVAADSGSLALYGDILTADADAGRENVQVASHGGVIEFDVEYPAPNDAYVPAKVVVYSVAGTAFGELVLVRVP